MKSMPYLVISEKPSQSRKLAAPFKHTDKKTHIEVEPCKTFPNGAIFVNAIGHLMELVAPEEYRKEWGGKWSLEQLPIIPEEQLRLMVTPSKIKNFNIIKKFLHSKEINLVIHCGDPAREGQLLIDEILFHLNNKKPVKRLWSTSLTKDSVIKAFHNLKDNKDYLPLYYEALARQHTDWIWGLNFSRLMTVLLQRSGFNGRDSTFSVGRVQTGLTGIIYKREREIESFRSSPYWDVYADFESGGQTYRGKWFMPQEEHIFNYKKASIFADYCKGKQAEIYDVKSEEKELPPPQFYNLNSLQSEGNKLLGLSPKKILQLAQGLYERSLISYPRAEPKHVTPEEAKTFPSILENLSKIDEYKEFFPTPLKDISGNKRFVDQSKTDDHYAIILTEEKVNLPSLSNEERVIYDIIAKSMITAHFPNAVYQQSQIVSVIDEQFSFKTNGKRLINEGWKRVHKGTTSQPDEKGDIVIPDVKEGDLLLIKGIELKEGATTAPPRFTQGDLVNVMANAAAYLEKLERENFSKSELALGTVATRADIINKITSINYISIKKNKVFLETKGRVLIEAFAGNSLFTSPLTTGKMEQYLMSIGKSSVKESKEKYSRFLDRVKAITKENLPKIINTSQSWDFQEYLDEMRAETEIGACLLCSKPVIDKGKFYGCSGYADNTCDFTLNKQYFGKTLSVLHIKGLLEKGTTPLIKDFKKKNKEGTYDAFLVWDKEQQRVKLSFEGIPKKKGFQKIYVK